MTDGLPLRPGALGIVLDVVAWYGVHARDLPWRRSPTPYRVLLSELMAQQTRIDTVLPYFERFVSRWPTIHDLAMASEQEVVEAWAGLGYYRRARNLHRCARAASDLGGLPSTAAALRELPGIGPYTAGAIASIAFGERTPLVDGNVERVLCRIDGYGEDPRKGPGKRALWERAARLHEVAPADVHPGELNQALMELGALVCTQSPGCGTCPVADRCVALATERVGELPAKAARKPPVPISGVALVVNTPEGVLMGRRPAGELLGGLWEPIRVPLDGGEAPELVIAELTGRLCSGAGRAAHAGTVVHVFTHRRLTCDVYVVDAEGHSGHVPAAYECIEVRALRGRSGMSTLARKIVAVAGIG